MDIQTEYRERYGFDRRDVSLATWRQQPHSKWAFEHVRELVPTASMTSGPSGNPSKLPGLEALGASKERIADYLGKSFSDQLLVLKGGSPVCSWTAPHSNPCSAHILFSVSKSVTGLIAGLLQQSGALDFDASVADYLTRLSGTPWEDATVRNVLDMRVSMDVAESYGSADGWGARYCRAVLWDPLEPNAYESHISVLRSAKRGAEAHGGPFRYRSANSDILGLICEAATKLPFATLADEFLWKHLPTAGDAYISLDREGTAQTAGGMCMSAFNLALIGECMRGSRSLAFHVPGAFLSDTFSDLHEDFWSMGDFAARYPGARYRSQWYKLDQDDNAFFAHGIHGQWLYVSPKTETTIVKFSSRNNPEQKTLDDEDLILFGDIVSALC